MDSEAWKQWVEETLAANGKGDIYIVDLEYKADEQILKVFIDHDSGLTLDMCRDVNKMLTRLLDETPWLGDSYRLDVSSPGADKPLRLQRQYTKHQGRVVTVTLVDGTLKTGRLGHVVDTGFTLEEEIPAPKGRKPKYREGRKISWEEVQQTIVEIRF